jgi:hypothetical protein
VRGIRVTRPAPVVAAAQIEATATGPSPRERPAQPPNELWQTRRPISPEERRLFQETVLRHREEFSRSEDLSATEDRRMQREAFRRALVERGIPLLSRRRIPVPITTKKTANTM